MTHNPLERLSNLKQSNTATRWARDLSGGTSSHSIVRPGELPSLWGKKTHPKIRFSPESDRCLTVL